MNRFNAKTKLNDFGCLVWTGAKNSTGYGTFRVNGKTVLAHRYNYYMIKKEDISGKLLCHKCDNRACVNVDHLFLGTYKDNIQDCITKNRRNTPNGESHHKARLTKNDILTIRAAKKYRGYIRDLAIKFSVTQSNISHIIHGKLWTKL